MRLWKVDEADQNRVVVVAFECDRIVHDAIPSSSDCQDAPEGAGQLFQAKVFLDAIYESGAQFLPLAVHRQD